MNFGPNFCSADSRVADDDHSPASRPIQGRTGNTRSLSTETEPDDRCAGDQRKAAPIPIRPAPAHPDRIFPDLAITRSNISS